MVSIAPFSARAGSAGQGDRSPAVVRVLGIPGDDRRVAHGDVELGEQAGHPAKGCRPAAGATASAIEFQCPGGVYVPELSFQNLAIWVSSAVRVVLLTSPRFKVSLTAFAYSWLVIDGGGGGLKLAVARHRKRLKRGPLRVFSGCKRRRRRLPVARPPIPECSR